MHINADWKSNAGLYLKTKINGPGSTDAAKCSSRYYSAVHSGWTIDRYFTFSILNLMNSSK